MYFKSLFFATVSTVLLAPAILLGQTTSGPTAVSAWDVNIRVYGVSRGVSMPTTATYYPNDCSCGNASHTTETNGRYFAHFHVPNVFAGGQTYSGTMILSNGDSVSIVASATTKKAFYDHKYSDGYTSSGTENTSQNCWGFSLGYNTWVNDPEYIYDDDYHLVEYPVNGCVVKGTVHIVTVVEVENGTMIAKTKEKFRGSRIYSKTHPGGGYYSDYLYEKNTN